MRYLGGLYCQARSSKVTNSLYVTSINHHLILGLCLKCLCLTFAKATVSWGETVIFQVGWDGINFELCGHTYSTLHHVNLPLSCQPGLSNHKEELTGGLEEPIILRDSPWSRSSRWGSSLLHFPLIDVTLLVTLLDREAWVWSQAKLLCS